MKLKEKEKTPKAMYLSIPFVAISLVLPYVAHLCPMLSKSTPVIKISSGEIQGRSGYSLRTGREFWQFLSIPFAEAPVGKLKFQPPVPLQNSWDGVKQVTRYPKVCKQYEMMGTETVQGSEDCLYLNVFVSNPKRKSLLKPNRPVLVYIPGGGFCCMGSKYFHPDFFMDQDDIVLVTFNYRLGPLGFLNLAEPDNYNSSNLNLPRGNMGLKDQLLVLKWVQKNIAKFGGNPKKVTIFGQSAGGASVNYHMVSEKSRGLFHKAISFSGTALSPWAFIHNARKISRKFYAKKMGCPLDDKEKLLECLLNADVDKLVRLQKRIGSPASENDMMVPSVEVVKTEDTFLDELPIETMKSGRSAKVPWILGATSGDGGIISARFEAVENSAEILEKNWKKNVAFFTLDKREEVSNNLAQNMRSLIFGSDVPFKSIEKEKFLQTISKLSSDSMFYRVVHKVASEHARNEAPAYIYYYNYTTTGVISIYSFYRTPSPNEWMFPKLKMIYTMAQDIAMEVMFGVQSTRKYGVMHADELFQLWNIDGFLGYLFGSDREFSNDWIQTIVGFARDDEKMPPTFRGVNWPAVSQLDAYSNISSKAFPCMLVDNSETPKVIPEPYFDSLHIYDTAEAEIS